MDEKLLLLIHLLCQVKSVEIENYLWEKVNKLGITENIIYNENFTDNEQFIKDCIDGKYELIKKH